MIKRMMNDLYDRICHLIFPRKCAVCGEIISYDALLCSECETALGVIGENCCEKCGKPPEDCICGRYPQHCERCASAVEFYESGKKIVYDFKFENQSALSRPMAKMMAQTVLLRFEDKKFDLVIGAPMRRSAVMKRGYNQAERLAKELAIFLEIPYGKGVLVKLRKTAHQSELHAAERFTNIKGAVGVSKKAAEKIKGKTILLADDIITTGATLNECAETLLQSGAAAVYGITFASTVREIP